MSQFPIDKFMKQNDKFQMKHLNFRLKKKIKRFCLQFRFFCGLAIEIQRQPFGHVLQNRYSQKLCNIQRKTPVLEPLFNKPPTSLKRDSDAGVFL